MSIINTADDEVTHCLQLLADGVPLSLLIDLAAGPHSEEVYLSEPSDVAWLVPAQRDLVAV